MDLLRLPIVGAFLRWPHARRVPQCALLLVAVVVVLHGLLGSPIAPRNLATVLTAIHWRGLLVVALLAVGNLFCTACPMMLVRDVARRLVRPTRRWPRVLRRKWIGIALLVAVLFAYELFDVWSLPRATVWLVLAYFGTALLVDLTFTGATFCKYLCPIGQFNFIASTISPTEVQIREIATCRGCLTSDCIKGRRAPGDPARVKLRGCELGLFLPMKVGNLDCTLCLDCVHACPHDNVAVATRLPAIEWLDTRHRSGIGRLSKRTDLAALATVFTFAAPLSAAVMTAPGRMLDRQLIEALGMRHEAPALAVVFAFGLVLIPLLLLAAASWATRWFTDTADSLARIGTQLAYALVPFGFGSWLAHYGYHLLTGALTVIPVSQSAALDTFGTAVLGEPFWRLTGLRPGAVLPFEVGFVLLGALGSFALIQSTAERDFGSGRVATTVVWTLVLLLLVAASLWIFAQPMDMRGVSAFR